MVSRKGLDEKLIGKIRKSELLLDRMNEEESR